MAPSRLKPTTKFWLGAYRFQVQQAGSIREPILGLYVGDSSASRYVGWFSNFPQHAVDWSLIHNKPITYTNFSGLGQDAKLTHFEVVEPITIAQLIPKDNRTQIGVAQQRKASMMVRFIINYGNESRHSFMVEYPGVAPKDIFGKPYWGQLQIMGDTPYSMDYMEPSHQ